MPCQVRRCCSLLDTGEQDGALIQMLSHIRVVETRSRRHRSCGRPILNRQLFIAPVAYNTGFMTELDKTPSNLVHSRSWNAAKSCRYQSGSCCFCKIYSVSFATKDVWNHVYLQSHSLVKHIQSMHHYACDDASRYVLQPEFSMLRTVIEVRQFSCFC